MPTAESPPPAPTAPWFTVELDGVILHVPLGEGRVFTLPMSADGAYALLGELAEQLARLKGDRELQRKLGAKAVDLVIDWAAKKWFK
jgi:hypothetical protein